ncbi:MAG TPA: cyclic nucleotide-binding domain-containing protein [Acidimicrobiales bacterium]|nr:cyclic nucleotide-binding domain-containing protein [Acidimicrobiales bacterium]
MSAFRTHGSGAKKKMSVKVQGVFKAAKERRQVPAGAVIFEAGDVGDEMFGVVDGSVELRTPGGRVMTLGPDDSFGEMGIVDSSPRSASAVALEDSTLAVIDRKVFLFLIGETPTFALQVMASLAERLRDQQG